MKIFPFFVFQVFQVNQIGLLNFVKNALTLLGADFPVFAQNLRF